MCIGGDSREHIGLNDDIPRKGFIKPKTLLGQMIKAQQGGNIQNQDTESVLILQSISSKTTILVPVIRFLSWVRKASYLMSMAITKCHGYFTVIAIDYGCYPVWYAPIE